MTTLYKRATPSQQRILRIVEGAVKNAADGHGLTWPHNFARSIAKRAAGTLTAQWPDVLAPKKASDKGIDRMRHDQFPHSVQVSKSCERRAESPYKLRSSLDKLWKDISKQCGAAKRADDQARLVVLIDVLRMIDARRKRSKLGDDE